MSNHEGTEMEKQLTSDKFLRLSYAQALTVVSVVLGTIGTIAYAIASFMQTQYMVNELKTGQKDLKIKVDSLEVTSRQIRETEKIDYIQLKSFVQASGKGINVPYSDFLPTSQNK